MKKKLYVGCSLSYAPEEFIEEVKKIKELLKEDFEILEFLGKTTGTARDVYNTDSGCVRDCDYFLAICDLPSLGVGYEIAYALSLKKPTIALAKDTAYVSRMIEGIDDKNFAFLRYTDWSDVPAIAKNKFL